MKTENTWEKYYKEHKGIYSSGHFTDRTDPDGQIANEYHIRYREEILSYAGSDKVALELGCGNKPIFDVLGQFKEIYYTDISPEAIEAAKKEFQSISKEYQGESSVYFQEMNVEKFTFEDQSIDVVFNTRAPHRDETSRELMRTLKSDGAYLYQTIGEEDIKDFKLLLKGGRFYEDYLVPGKTSFGVIRDSLVNAGFDEQNIALVFDKHFKSYFDSKAALKEKLWLLVGDYDFDLPENEKVLDEYISSHTNEGGKIWVDNHRIIVKVVKNLG